MGDIHTHILASRTLASAIALASVENRQGLKCYFSGCYFTTSATLKKCKARKQIKQHEEKHKKDLLKTEEDHTSDVVVADLADVGPEVGEAIIPQHTPGEEDIADGHVDRPEIMDSN